MSAVLGHSIRLLQFNIRHGRGALGRLDLERTARLITQTRPDVVALQEVDRHYGARSEYVDQPARLAELTGMEALFAPALRHEPEEGKKAPRDYGIAVLSRLPMTAVDLSPTPDPLGVPGRIALPLADGVPAGGAEQRVALAARIDVGSHRSFTLVTTHLEAFTSVHRRAQSQYLAKVLAPVHGAVALAGDMNTSPRSEELQALARTGWREAWRGRVDLSRLSAKTFPAVFPIRRIDHVRVRGPLRVESVRTLWTLASDHRPVLATLRLT